MEDLREKSEHLIALAEDYKKSRMKCAENRLKFKVILASKISELRAKKSNAGTEMLELLLLEDGNEEILGYYKLWMYHENAYKSLERLMEAIKESLHLEKFLGRIE